MRKISGFLILIALIVAGVLLSGARNTSAQGVGKIERMDPALDSLIPPGAKIEKLAGDLGFVEGPVWVHSSKPGFLIFSDIPANVIRKWTPDGKVSVYLDKTGFTGANVNCTRFAPSALLFHKSPCG